MSRVMHFEIHATQPQALVNYYTALFGWTFKHLPEMNYWMIETGPADQPGINGGLVQRRSGGPVEGQAVNSYVCTVGVESLDASLAKSASLGGTVALPKMAVPGVGWLAYVKDPDGNILGIIQPDTRAA